jgi:ABC-type uncharacterized transport system substrate-binding protein
MRRREFIALLGAAAANLSSRVQGQQAIPVVGYLFLGSQSSSQPFFDAFLSGLSARGYIEGKNIRVLYRYADGHSDHLSPLTTELVSLGARVIVTSGGAGIERRTSVPIVSLIGSEPVDLGWAKSLAKPGGMITGVFFNTPSPKMLELLKVLKPQATRFGLLMNGNNPATPYLRKQRVDGARRMGIELEVIEFEGIVRTCCRL